MFMGGFLGLALLSNSLRAQRLRIYINDMWGAAVSKFYLRLSERLGGVFTALLALDERYEIYESNILIIVRKKDLETVREIMRIKREIEREYEDKIVISPYIAREDEEDVIKTFQRASQTEDMDPNVLREALKKFSERLRKAGYAIDILIPGYEIYESNILIIVRKKDLETVREIMRIKREIEREYEDKIVISPYIAREDEEDVIKTFQRASQTSN
jgi:ribosome biogenesis GTPase A